MVAGLNLIVDIIEYDYDSLSSDDEIGGALPSGTVAYVGAQARIRALKPEPALAQQGVETIDMFACVLYPGNVPANNHNVLEVKAPINSPWYGKKFRLVGDPLRSSTAASDSRGYVLCTLQHVERSRGIQ